MSTSSSGSNNSFTAVSGSPPIVIGTPNTPGNGSTSAAKKRNVISLACSTCRKRKTKCDGRKPACTQCLNTGKESECIYDANTDRRRSWHARQNKLLAQRLEQAEGLIERIRRGGKDAEDAMKEIQTMGNSATIKSEINPSSIPQVQLPSVTEDARESDLILDEEGQVHFFGGTSNLGEIKQSLTISGRTQHNKAALESVLNKDDEMVIHQQQPQQQRQLQPQQQQYQYQQFHQNPQFHHSQDIKPLLNGPAPTIITATTTATSSSASSPVMTLPRSNSILNASAMGLPSAMSPPTPTSPPLTGQFYTVQKVDIPVALIHHLLDLYFCWQHTYYNIFNKESFLQDLHTGGKFYSKFLLNAVLAHAAQLCDSPILRSDPSDPSTAGYMFFNEARSQIDQELLKRSVTTVQGLLLLASREAGIGRDTVGWVYSGMAFRMALDLGLHLDCKSLLDCGFLTEQDYIVRNATFWGCYLFDQGWSTYLGRPSVIHLSDVTVERPEFIVNERPEEWRPVFNNAPNQPISQRIVGPPVPFYMQNTLTAILRLSEIIEDTQVSLYSPRRNQKKEGAAKVQEKVKNLFEKLTTWEFSLPLEMRQGEGADHPSVLLLYTLYYATKIFLFRPFVRVRENGNGNGSTTSTTGGGALYQCLDAAENIVNILRRFRDLYTLRLATNMSVYISFTAATASFAKPGDEGLERQLAECMEFLKEIGESWTSANTVGEGIKARLLSTSIQAGTNISSVNPAEQIIPFAPFAVGTPNYFEPLDFYNYETVPDFEFLIESGPRGYTG